MVQAYWQVGRLIVEQKQRGQEQAEYDEQQLGQLSRRLHEQFGKGFDASNLRNIRRFYLVFLKRDTLSLELSWSHFNIFSRLKNSQARVWYMQEAT